MPLDSVSGERCGDRVLVWMPRRVGRFAKPSWAARIEPDMPAHPTSLHWPEYLIEAGALGTFMVSAAAFAAVLYYPASPVAALVSNELARRGLMGLAMGATAVSIIYSPW